MGEVRGARYPRVEALSIERRRLGLVATQEFVPQEVATCNETQRRDPGAGVAGQAAEFYAMREPGCPPHNER